MKKTREDYRIIPYNDGYINGYIIEVMCKFLCFNYWKIVDKLIFIPDFFSSFDSYETVFIKLQKKLKVI